jgi:glycosyltransferase involved in cell wall biosynthesis
LSCGEQVAASGSPLAPLRLLALVQKPEGVAPHQRFRVEQWIPELATRHGIEVELRPFESPELGELLYRSGHTMRKAALCVADARRLWRARDDAAAFDGVIVVREASMVGGAWFERYLARHGVPFVYDFDDAIWRASVSGTNGLLTLARMPWKVEQICRLASGVTVGNDYLAAYARRYNDNVHIVRTSIDLTRFRPMSESAPSLPLRVVWTGTHSTLTHLEHIRPALERLGAARPTVLRVVCDREPDRFENVQVEFVRWSAASEAHDLTASHIGIMPLPDDEWTRGKCGCKALQYMAIGRAVVVSPVGMNTEIIRDGENGLFARSHDDWFQQLLRLGNDAALRHRLAMAGRSTVEREYSAAAAADRFADVARSVFSARAKLPRLERSGA